MTLTWQHSMREARSRQGISATNHVMPIPTTSISARSDRRLFWSRRRRRGFVTAIDRSKLACFSAMPRLYQSLQALSQTSTRVDLKKLAETQSAVPASGNAIVLFVRDGHSYCIVAERADFMPRDHFSICIMKDFADPKVAETLKKIQEARAKEKKPEQDAAKPAQGK